MRYPRASGLSTWSLPGRLARLIPTTAASLSMKPSIAMTFAYASRPRNAEEGSGLDGCRKGRRRSDRHSAGVHCACASPQMGCRKLGRQWHWAMPALTSMAPPPCPTTTVVILHRSATCFCAWPFARHPRLDIVRSVVAVWKVEVSADPAVRRRIQTVTANPNLS